MTHIHHFEPSFDYSSNIQFCIICDAISFEGKIYVPQLTKEV